VVVLALDGAGTLAREPELRGAGVDRLEPLDAELRGELRRAVEALAPAERADRARVEELVRLTVRRIFRKQTGRRPAVLPVIIEPWT
jgi:mRNA degradation ribonuclease J1/J2